MTRIPGVRSLRLAGLLAVGAALVALPAFAGQDAGQEKKPPPKEETKAVGAEIGKAAPAFELKDLDGKTVKLADFKDKTVVLEWFNPGCPYCAYAYSEKGPLRKLPETLKAKGVVWLSVVSEKPDNPGGKLETIQKFVKANEMSAPLLLDPDGKVGRAYGAKTTPHMFVIDGKGVLVYQGALDNSPFGKTEEGQQPVNHVEAALADLAAGKRVAKAETRPYG